MKKHCVVAIGEILMDVFPSGARLGGAPANVAWHARSFGADARMLSRIGRDEIGARILECLRGSGLAIDGLAVDEDHPTGTVEVQLSVNGQPTYTIHEGVAWDFLQAGPFEFELASRADAVCFGSLAQRHPVSRRAIRELLAATRKDGLRFFDINLRQNYYSREVIDASLEAANALKLNDEELPILAAYYGLNGGEQAVVSALADRFQLRLVALTRGGRGSLLWADGKVDEHPGCPAKAIDCVGAGDCFAAAVTVGFLAGLDLRAINDRANRAAAFVCENNGATPELPSAFSFSQGQRSES